MNMVIVDNLFGIQYTTDNYKPIGGLPELHTHYGSHIARTFICMRHKLISSCMQHIYNH